MATVGTLSIEILVIALTGLISVLGVYGGLIKVVYDGHRQLNQTLRGPPDDTGFIQDIQKQHEQIVRTQAEIERTLDAHSSLLREMVYILHDIADSFDEEEMSDVDMRRLQYLQKSISEDDDYMVDFEDDEN
jgi:hypothetical protein